MVIWLEKLSGDDEVSSTTLQNNSIKKTVTSIKFIPVAKVSDL